MKNSRQLRELGIFALVSVIVSSIFTALGINLQIYDRITFISLQINIITINSIIAGFSFTSLGILISLFDTKEIKGLEKTDIRLKKNERLVSSIIFLSFSILISLIYVFGIDQIVKNVLLMIGMKGFVVSIVEKANIVLCCFSYVLMFAGIIYFIKSIFQVSQLLNKIYSNKSTLTKEEVNDIKNAFKEKNK